MVLLNPKPAPAGEQAESSGRTLEIPDVASAGALSPAASLRSRDVP